MKTKSNMTVKDKIKSFTGRQIYREAENTPKKEIALVMSGVINLFGIPKDKLRDFLMEFINFIAEYKFKNKI